MTFATLLVVPPWGVLSSMSPLADPGSAFSRWLGLRLPPSFPQRSPLSAVKPCSTCAAVAARPPCMGAERSRWAFLLFSSRRRRRGRCRRCRRHRYRHRRHRHTLVARRSASEEPFAFPGVGGIKGLTAPGAWALGSLFAYPVRCATSAPQCPGGRRAAHSSASTGGTHVG